MSITMRVVIDIHQHSSILLLSLWKIAIATPENQQQIVDIVRFLRLNICNVSEQMFSVKADFYAIGRLAFAPHSVHEPS